MMNNINPEGPTEFRVYLATVVDVDDPLQFQRIRVIVPGLLEGGNDTLPWCLPIQGSLFGTGTSHGVFGVPPVGSTVYVHFQGDDLLYGLSFGSPPLKNSDLAPLKVNYPYRYGFVDPVGNVFYVDTTVGQTTVHFEHISGMKFQVSDTGTITVTSPEDLDLQITRDLKIAVNGNVSAVVRGGVNAGIVGSLTATVSGFTNLAYSGGIQTNAPAWTHVGPMMVNGSLAVSGPLTAASVRDTSGNVGLATHTHGGVEGGNNVTLPPAG